MQAMIRDQQTSQFSLASCTESKHAVGLHVMSALFSSKSQTLKSAEHVLMRKRAKTGLGRRKGKGQEAAHGPDCKEPANRVGPCNAYGTTNTSAAVDDAAGETKCR